MIEKIRLWLQGKKTYLVAIVAVLTALIAFANGVLSILGLGEAILAALGLTTIRAAISKIIEAIKGKVIEG
jgi:hypothetical protein